MRLFWRIADMTTSLNDHEYSEEVLQRTTAANLEDSSSRSHEIIDLYTLAEDCEHINPYEDEKYEAVDDLIDAWMERNCAGLSYDDTLGKPGVTYDFVQKNRIRAQWAVPLNVEYILAEREYSAHHGYVCLLNPMGSCCKACSEGDDDWGYEPGSCQRQSLAKDRQDEFWDLFTQDNFDYLKEHNARV